MKKSEKVACWVGVVVFCIGFFISPFVFLPLRATKSQEISLSFPGEARSVVFSEVSFDDFGELALEESYYQINYKAEGITVQAIGLQGNTVYTAEGSFYWNDGYKTIGFLYQNDKITTSEERDLIAYLISILVIMFVGACFSVFLALITYGIVRALEKTRT